MTAEVIAALSGAGVGAIGTSPLSFVLGALNDHARNQAIRIQILSLMRVVQQQMLMAAKYHAVPLDGWFSLDRVTERTYSTDGAHALSSTNNKAVFSAIAELQQIRAAIQYTHDKLMQPRYSRSGPAIVTTVSEQQINEWREEIRAAGRRGVQLLIEARSSLRDDTIVEDLVTDPGEAQ